MCGIFGITGVRPVRSVLLDGLRRLEYRGYDSAGLAVCDTTLHLYKCIGRVDDLEQIVPEPLVGHCGVAHTRWATHGRVTTENAHPHLSQDGQVAVVHNGIIENARALRNWLAIEGVQLRSDTDSEVIVHLICRALNDGLDPLNAVQLALIHIRGTWGICVIFEAHSMMICARNGSPLVVGIGRGETLVASDPHALTPYTEEVLFLEDGDIAVLTPDDVQMSRLDGSVSEAAVTTMDRSWGMSELGDFPHFMLKEIHEQPEALRQCIFGRTILTDGTVKLGGLDLSVEALQCIPHVRLLGCGTALHACQVGQLAIEYLARVPSMAHVASEFRHNDPVIDSQALYFAVSQSGETADTLSVVREVQLNGGKVMGVINVVGSSIARLCGQGIYIHSGPEQAVASTKAFANMVAALTLFAIQIGRARSLSRQNGRKIVSALHAIPEQLEYYLSNSGPIADAVDAVKDARLVLFLGRGPSTPVAFEGALKLMEVAYIPCLAYSAGEMKHGPIALLEQGTPVVVIAPHDKFREKTISNIEECRARGARIILVHDHGDPIGDYADISIPVPSTDTILSPLLTVVPLQLLAYETGLARGCDVDKPRNLATSVTVE